MEHYDLIVLGGGPAGYLASERASAGGLKTALFEERALGGVCLNEGCIPTKAMLYPAKLLYGALHGAAYGLSAAGASLSHAGVLARKASVVKTLVSGVAAKLKAAGVTVRQDHAVIEGRGASGYIVAAGGERFAADRLLIATGSAPVTPPIPGVREGLASGFALTSREILELGEVPERLVIVGGGVIGLEMADYYNMAGSQVTVVEMLDKIAGPMEGEISKILLANLQRRGIAFRLGSQVTGLAEGTGQGGGGVVVKAAADGADKAATAAETLPADKVLLSIGRRPRTADIGLESIGLYLERGAIVTDRNLRTNLPGVYAAGDVNGKLMLAHTAYREAETAVNHMLGKTDAMRYDAISSVVYTNPEAASVGETQESAAEKGLQARTVKLSMRYAGRYVAEHAEGGDGIAKLVFDARSRRLIGAHLIGSYASEIVVAAAMMIESRWPVEALQKLVFPHPTVGEILREALFL
ncbi:MAG: dihydrolipoyl dehydrogenase [Clostridiales bacterium]|jgi:dihydrolipoamide dehydrogenase|nr:dihydrolipoyl dehydrogenase [Clostridiales bacterium]